jgi:hypothetical protein
MMKGSRNGEIRRSGDPETRKCGNVETWKCGNGEKWIYEDYLSKKKKY